MLVHLIWLIMIWAGIIGNELMGPYRLEDGLKMKSKTYCGFLYQHLIEWLENQFFTKL